MISKKTMIIQIISIMSALTIILGVFILTWIRNQETMNVWIILGIPLLIYILLATFGVGFTIWQYKQNDV